MYRRTYSVQVLYHPASSMRYLYEARWAGALDGRGRLQFLVCTGEVQNACPLDGERSSAASYESYLVQLCRAFCVRRQQMQIGCSTYAVQILYNRHPGDSGREMPIWKRDSA
jgi:hypothetical protein